MVVYFEWRNRSKERSRPVMKEVGWLLLSLSPSLSLSFSLSFSVSLSLCSGPGSTGGGDGSRRSSGGVGTGKIGLKEVERGSVGGVVSWFVEMSGMEEVSCVELNRVSAMCVCGVGGGKEQGFYLTTRTGDGRGAAAGFAGSDAMFQLDSRDLIANQSSSQDFGDPSTVRGMRDIRQYSWTRWIGAGKYFPRADNDSVSVWEDESVVFDVLSNDYVSDGQVSLIGFYKPLHGSLLQFGKLFRYTPFKGYFGNDSFLYNITDSNNNVAIGAAFISVLCKPPQFISLPLQLNVTEDLLSPQFGGFPGFEIRYSDKKENISLTISAKFGSVYLAPSPIVISEPVGGMLSIRRGGRAGKDLILVGPIEVINSALQLIQYLSNENFYGDDTLSLYAMNKNGIQDSHVAVFVKPINDPPKIHVPNFITLVGNEASDDFQLFDKQRDFFEFSITESDIFHYPGNRSHLMVMFSVEVNDGLLSTTLPVHLIKTAEVKIKSSNQWQPLQTFVTIANQFVMRGKGIRFQGTIGDCNNAMQRLFFQGANLEALLTITVNDLGNYGCYLDCTDIMSFPLSVEATVILIKRRPLNSTTAFLLGSAIFFEIATLFLLGGLLLFFICKCMIALHIEGKNDDNIQSLHKEELIKNHNEKIRRRIRPQESELPLSFASFGNNHQLNPPHIEMQKQPHSD